MLQKALYIQYLADEWNINSILTKSDERTCTFSFVGKLTVKEIRELYTLSIQRYVEEYHKLQLFGVTNYLYENYSYVEIMYAIHCCLENIKTYFHEKQVAAMKRKK